MALLDEFLKFAEQHAEPDLLEFIRAIVPPAPKLPPIQKQTEPTGGEEPLASTPEGG